MSKSSESVKKWRKTTKDRIIKAMGGSCVCCGYNRYTGALELHHKDPNKKDFSIGSIRASIKSWERIVKELKNCVLVCSNCHKEIHGGIIQIPIGAFCFNETYYKYEELGIRGELHPCPVCNKLIPKFKVTCSYKCAAKYHSHVDWNSIDLIEMLKDKSVLEIADMFNVSNGTIYKRIRRIKSGKWNK
jgi:hypothetical protein